MILSAAYSGSMTSGPVRIGKPDHDVISITTAPRPPAEELSRRQRQYVITMSVRTVAFIAAVLLINTPWISGALVFGSLLVPYLAVMVANRISPRRVEPIDGPAQTERELSGD